MNDVITIKKCSNYDALRISSSNKANKESMTLKELFVNWHDDGIRDRELDWGKDQGNELKW